MNKYLLRAYHVPEPTVEIILKYTFPTTILSSLWLLIKLVTIYNYLPMGLGTSYQACATKAKWINKLGLGLK